MTDAQVKQLAASFFRLSMFHKMMMIEWEAMKNTYPIPKLNYILKRAGDGHERLIQELGRFGNNALHVSQLTQELSKDDVFVIHEMIDEVMLMPYANKQTALYMLQKLKDGKAYVLDNGTPNNIRVDEAF